jgi:hypothetical protein
LIEKGLNNLKHTFHLLEKFIGCNNTAYLKGNIWERDRRQIVPDCKRYKKNADENTKIIRHKIFLKYV